MQISLETGAKKILTPASANGNPEAKVLMRKNRDQLFSMKAVLDDFLFYQRRLCQIFR
jgi:hypothetical protein